MRMHYLIVLLRILEEVPRKIFVDAFNDGILRLDFHGHFDYNSHQPKRMDVAFEVWGVSVYELYVAIRIYHSHLGDIVGKWLVSDTASMRSCHYGANHIYVRQRWQILEGHLFFDESFQ